jgi:hypothetical protein
MPSKRQPGKRGSYKARWEREAKEFKAELEKNITHFEKAVLTSFSFLETEYGFRRRGLERRDFEDYRDANVVVPYYGATVAVCAYYYVGDIRVGAACYELENGRMPERVSFYGDPGYARAINVDSCVAMASGGTIAPILPEPSPRQPRIGEFRAADLRRQALKTNMAGVVAEVARRLKTFCAPALKGDTSNFSAVQRFHKQRQG